MNVAVTASEAESQISISEVDSLVKNIVIPPRPKTLIDLQAEMRKEEPDFRRVARMVASDVTLTVAALRIVTSPAYGLRRRCESVDEAISMIGLKQLNTIVTGLVLRNVLRTDGQQLTRFWDVSAKRAHVLRRMAREVGQVDVDVAHSFGLFCDVGIPLLMRRFPDYGRTLKACNDEATLSFTEVEHSFHQTDHALLGAMMARSWGLSQPLCLAIRLHHDYGIFQDPQVPELVTRLISMGLVAEIAIQRFANLNTSTEWNKGGSQACGALLFNDQDVEDWIERLLVEFSSGLA